MGHNGTTNFYLDPQTLEVQQLRLSPHCLESSQPKGEEFKELEYREDGYVLNLVLCG